MRGLGRRLERVATHQRARATRARRDDLEQFTSEELRELDDLVAKAEAARQGGRAVVWTPEAAAALAQLSEVYEARRRW